jgi:hypothetical protein
MGCDQSKASVILTIPPGTTTLNMNDVDELLTGQGLTNKKKQVTGIVFPDSLQFILMYAFTNFDSVEKVELPPNFVSIADRASWGAIISPPSSFHQVALNLVNLH